MYLKENNKASVSRYFEVGEKVVVCKGFFKGDAGTIIGVIKENIGDISNFNGSSTAKVLYTLDLGLYGKVVVNHGEVRLDISDDDPVAYQINMMESYGSSR